MVETDLISLTKNPRAEDLPRVDEALPDPLDDRVAKNVPCLPNKRLTEERIFGE